MSLKHFSLAALLLLFGCRGTGNEWKKTDFIPAAPGATVQLRVVHAVNPRLPRMTPAQLDMMMAATRKTVQDHFGVNVEFAKVDEVGIDQLFAIIPAQVLKQRQSSIYDFKNGKGDRHKLAAGINATLTERGTTLVDGLAFAQPYMPDAHPKNLMEFSETLTDVMLERLNYWRKVKAADGAPLINGSPYNEWVYWDTLGYGKLQYDVVITNQLIASAEYVAVDIHGAIRGGVTVGTSTYSRSSRFGSHVFWSTFPFTDTSKYTLSQRGNERYSDTEAAQLSGAYLAHEVGHMLFHFGHPFGQKSCVMNPVSMLRFREWSQQIDSKACTMGSRPEMTAGAISEFYNVNWLRLSRQP